MPIDNREVYRPAEKQLLERGLSSLPELPANQQISGKIIIVPRGQSRIMHVCPRTKMRTVIDLHDSNLRVMTGNSLMDEFECQCGTIFQKEK